MLNRSGLIVIEGLDGSGKQLSLKGFRFISVKRHKA